MNHSRDYNHLFFMIIQSCGLQNLITYIILKQIKQNNKNKLLCSADLFSVRHRLLLLSFFHTEIFAVVRKISTSSLAHVFQLVIDFNRICLYSACLRIILDTAIFILPFTRPFQKLANDFPISSSFFSDLRLFSELCGQIFIYQYKVLRNLSCFWVQLLGYSEHKHYDLDPGYLINSILWWILLCCHLRCLSFIFSSFSFFLLNQPLLMFVMLKFLLLFSSGESLFGFLLLLSILTLLLLTSIVVTTISLMLNLI